MFLPDILHTSLQELLQEIAEEQRKGDGVVHDDENNECGIVLVACKDERSCLQLQECISRSPQQVTAVCLECSQINLIAQLLFNFHCLSAHMYLFLLKCKFILTS